MPLLMMYHLHARLKILKYFKLEVQMMRFYRNSCQVLCRHWQFERKLYLELSTR